MKAHRLQFKPQRAESREPRGLLAAIYCDGQTSTWRHAPVSSGTREAAGTARRVCVVDAPSVKVPLLLKNDLRPRSRSERHTECGLLKTQTEVRHKTVSHGWIDSAEKLAGTHVGKQNSLRICSWNDHSWCGFRSMLPWPFMAIPAAGGDRPVLQHGSAELASTVALPATARRLWRRAVAGRAPKDTATKQKLPTQPPVGSMNNYDCPGKTPAFTTGYPKPIQNR